MPVSGVRNSWLTIETNSALRPIEALELLDGLTLAPEGLDRREGRGDLIGEEPDIRASSSVYRTVGSYERCRERPVRAAADQRHREARAQAGLLTDRGASSHVW
jgi:hypothetical protein